MLSAAVKCRGTPGGQGPLATPPTCGPLVILVTRPEALAIPQNGRDYEANWAHLWAMSDFVSPSQALGIRQTIGVRQPNGPLPGHL